MPDPTSRICFSCVISEEGMDRIAQNRPGSDPDGLARVGPNASGLEASRCAGITGPGFWLDATGPLPVSHFQTRFRSSTDKNIVQNQPGSDLGGLVRVWPNASGLEASRCAGITGPGFWLDATGPLPVSHFQTRFRSSTDVPDNIVQNQPGSDLVLPDCVRFWPNGSGPEASRCARIIRPASGHCFRADPDRIRIGSGMFMGIYCPAHFWLYAGRNGHNWP